MIVDLNRLAAPDLPLVLEAAHQFALLGIDADDGRMLLAEAPSLDVDVKELSIALGARRTHTLAVGMEGKAELVEQPGHGIRSRWEAQALQMRADWTQTQPGPKPAAAHGIARGARFQQGAQRIDYFGRFFPTALRPPPARRVRSRSTSPVSNSRRPRATVATSKPSNSAMRRSPPWPF